MIVRGDAIISDGYNGTPSGFENICEDENNKTKPYVLHAEANAITKVAKDLEKADVHITIEPKIEVQNIVASSDLEQEINLNTVAITLGLEKVEYEPEQFPGLVYRLDDPKVVVLLFGSGKMVCTGAKVPEDVTRAVDKIAAELRSASLMV